MKDWVMRVFLFVMGVGIGALILAIIDVRIERKEKDYQGRGELMVLIRHKPGGPGVIGGTNFIGGNDGCGRAVIWFADAQQTEMFRHYLLRHARDQWEARNRLDPDAIIVAENLSEPEWAEARKKILETWPGLAKLREENP